MFPMLLTHLEILIGLLLGVLLLKSEKLLLTLSQSISVRIGFKFQNMQRFLGKLLLLKLHKKIEKGRGRKTQLLYHFQCTELVFIEVISKKVSGVAPNIASNYSFSTVSHYLTI